MTNNRQYFWVEERNVEVYKKEGFIIDNLDRHKGQCIDGKKTYLMSREIIKNGNN